MAQRVMIAMALACEPDLLIADEPTTALDVTIQAQILDLMRDLQRDSNTAVVLITHDLGIVAEMADRVAVMYAGEIVEEADVKTLFSDPKHPYTKGLIGSVPVLGHTKAALDVIPGNVPNLIDLPPGCRFASAVCRARRERPRDLHATEARVPQGGGGPQRAVLAVRGGDRMTEPLVQIRDLVKDFPIKGGILQRTKGHVRAVAGVSLDIHKGETLGLVGESGCGKSTLGRMLVRLHRTDRRRHPVRR